MPVSFSNTTHTLNSDPYQNLTRLGLIIALMLMLIWVAWFFWGEMHHYVSSQSTSIHQEAQPVWRISSGSNISTPFKRYTIKAYFSAQDLARIHKGQAAALYFSDHNSLPSRPIKTSVVSVDKKTGEVQLNMEVPEKKGDTTVDEYRHAPKVEVVVLRESPAAFLFHTVTQQKPTAASPIHSSN